MKTLKCICIGILLVTFLMFFGLTVCAKENLILMTHPVDAQGTIIELDLVREFEEEYGVEVTIISVGYQYYVDQLLNYVVAGNPPDVLYNAASMVGGFVDAGVIHSLTPFIETDADFDLDDFFGSIVEGLSIDGQVYAIPRGNQSLVMYYNRTAFAENALEGPRLGWAWDGEFLQAARRLTEDSDGDGNVDRWGLLEHAWWWWPIIWSYGGSFLDEAEELYVLNQPAGIAALQFAASLANEYQVSPGGALGLINRNTFASEMGAMFPDDAVGSAVFATMDLSFEWDVVELPEGPLGPATTLNGAGYSIAKTSSNPELAWELIKKLTSEDGIRRLTRAFAVGQVVPSRRSVAVSDDFLLAPPPPANRLAFLNSLEYAQTPFVGGSAWTRLEQVLNGTLQTILLGYSPPQQALDAIVPVIKALLRR